METASEPKSRPATKRQQRRAAIEKRLIEAALDLVHDRGVQSLTTVAIAKAAGIHQPNFYAYFKNIDDLMSAAAQHVAKRLHRLDSEAFQAVRRAVENGEPHTELNIAYHINLLDLLLDEPRYTELFFRHRGDASAYGRELRRVEQEFVESVTEHLWDWGIRVGLRGRHLSDIQLLAELQVSAVATAVLSLLEGRSTDRKAVGTMLAYNADVTTRATFRRLLTEC